MSYGAGNEGVKRRFTLRTDLVGVCFDLLPVRFIDLLVHPATNEFGQGEGDDAGDYDLKEYHREQCKCE